MPSPCTGAFVQMIDSKLESPSHRSGRSAAPMPRATLVSSFMEAMSPMLGVGVASAASPARPSPSTPMSASLVSTATAGSSAVFPSMRFSARIRTVRPSATSSTRTTVTMSSAVRALAPRIGVTP